MEILQIIFVTIILLINLIISEPDHHCLDCICHASTGCKRNIQCHNNGVGQYYCGPYQITWAYWADSGKPGDAGFPNDFEQCLIKKSCAEAAVRGYMKRYGNDCNGDGIIDCYDFAAIHKTGPSGSCQPSWLLESKYWLEFQQCYSQSSSPSTSTSARTSRNNSNQPSSNTMIEIPRNKPSFLPPLPPLPPPLILPPVHAHASASVPGASASASASAGLDSNTGNPLTFTSTSIGNGNDGISTEIIETYPPLPAAPGRLSPSINRKPNQIAPVPGALINKPQPSTPVLVSENFNRFKPIKFDLPEPRNSPLRTINHSPIIKPVSDIEPPVGLETDLSIAQECFDCLCHASSKCDLNKGCDGAYCGPYLLSWGYWADGGKPNGEYATCSKQKSCSEVAIQGYMEKWKRDCNHDGKIDCIDFALIHKLGPHGCEKLQALQTTDYWKQFSQCHQNKGANKPVRHTTPSLVEIPKPQPLTVRSNESLPNSFENEHDTRDVVIRINNPNNNNINNNNLQPTLRPRTRIDLGTLNTSKPIIIRIKAQSNTNDPNHINIPDTNLRSTTIVEEPSNIIQPPKLIIRDNDDFFSQPRPFDQPSSRNEQPNVSEIRRPTPSVSTRPRSTTRTNVTRNNFIPIECLECICYASSKCNPSLGCRSEGTGKYVCGSYQVDLEYWMEAGKPGNRADLSNVENFQMCMTNRDCADKTVTAYLKRFKKDCNEDGQIDCNDYAALHIGGPNHCNAQWYLDSRYYSDFRECYDF